MMNQFIMDLKTSEHIEESDKMISLPYRICTTYEYRTADVLDLSRRRDSVETRKTPSPCNNSSFSEGSPSVFHCNSVRENVNSVPNQSQDSIVTSAYRPRTNISSPIFQYRLSSSASAYAGFGRFEKGCQPVETKRETPSPDEINKMYTTEQQNNFNPFVVQAAALQQHLVARLPIDPDESSEPSSILAPTTTTSNSSYPMLVGRDGKLARPFKAYPRDPLSLAASFTATDTILDSQSAEKYSSFRKRMIEQIHAANGGQPTISNPKMRRNAIKSSLNFGEEMVHSVETVHDNTENSNSSDNNKNYNNNLICLDNNSNGITKDNAYFERRKKNNAAAKKSRDRRRIKEDEIAIRAAFLERENIELKFELAAARKQLALYVPTSK